MRISTGTPMIETPALQRVDDTEAAAPAATAPAAAALLQSAVLQPALAALREMPDVDHAKVALLRDALAKGELPFDPARLAGLVQRFHGSSK
ncbi:MAG: flgM [Massilia sp.]|jgi:negative regulator of flagellin synthesis FlgM|nr:flgM [Massilia sp.]